MINYTALKTVFNNLLYFLFNEHTFKQLYYSQEQGRIDLSGISRC